MADRLRILGQLNPSPTTLTDLYVVPAGYYASVSSVVVVNRDTLPTSFRLAILASGASIDDKQYLYYDLPIAGKQTFVATIGITLSGYDKIQAYATSGVLSFNVFGVEVN